MDLDAARRLDVAVLRQALVDLRLPTDGFRMNAEQREECIDLMLEAARWFFTRPRADHVLNLERICERLGVDAGKLARRVFETLPPARQQEIREGLRHYRCPVLEAA